MVAGVKLVPATEAMPGIELQWSSTLVLELRTADGQMQASF